MSAEFKKVKQRILQLCPPWSQETIGRAIALLDDTAVQKLTGLPNAVFESAVNALLQQARGRGPSWLPLNKICRDMQQERPHLGMHFIADFILISHMCLHAARLRYYQ